MISVLFCYIRAMLPFLLLGSMVLIATALAFSSLNSFSLRLLVFIYISRWVLSSFTIGRWGFSSVTLIMIPVSFWYLPSRIRMASPCSKYFIICYLSTPRSSSKSSKLVGLKTTPCPFFSKFMMFPIVPWRSPPLIKILSFTLISS